MDRGEWQFESDKLEEVSRVWQIESDKLNVTSQERQVKKKNIKRYKSEGTSQKWHVNIDK